MTREVERSIQVTARGHLWLLVGKPATKLGLDGDAEFLALNHLGLPSLCGTRQGYEIHPPLGDGSEVTP